ncbi:MAG: 2-hydroxyacyl-CoA dehydratase [Chloroflexi bacterium]|nr:2-hydroxyacyl-CoA dehydratase [Chloroflexota bacterium]
MSSELRALQRIREINSSFPYAEPIQRWKAAGKKVIGTGCSYVPEEVIYAAGLLPIRVRGHSRESGIDEADAWLHPNTCSFQRGWFQMLLDGEYSFLDGFVSTYICDCHRRVADVARYLKLLPFVHLFEVPLVDDEDSIPRYLDYLRALIAALHTNFGVEITESDLRRGIATVNRKRDLLEQLRTLRTAGKPPISGTEMVEVQNAGFVMPADEFGDLLEELIAELKAEDRRLGSKFRLMLAGSCLNNPEFIAGIEELGGLVVADVTCMGISYWYRQVELEEGQSPLEAIARRYHNKIPCPQRTPFALRVESVLSLVRQHQVDGVILEVIMNCFPHGHTIASLARHLERQGIPSLQLEKEYGTGSTGQIRTRVQAFLESLTPAARAERITR